MIAIIVILAILIILGMASYVSSTKKAVALNQRLRELGNVKQYSYDAIVQKLGAPSATSAAAAGSRIVQWSARGYCVTMTFTQDGECLGIDSEIAT